MGLYGRPDNEPGTSRLKAVWCNLFHRKHHELHHAGGFCRFRYVCGKCGRRSVPF